jgi:hypothetical protein
VRADVGELEREHSGCDVVEPLRGQVGEPAESVDALPWAEVPHAEIDDASKPAHAIEVDHRVARELCAGVDAADPHACAPSVGRTHTPPGDSW